LSSIDWGDAPTWIGTVFGAAAAAFTLATLLSQRRQIQDQQAFIGEQLVNLRAEREALAAAAGERRSAQACQVTLRTRLVIGPEGPEDPDGYFFQVVVTNNSDRAITGVEADFGDLTAPQSPATRVTDRRIVDVPAGIGQCHAYVFASESSYLDRLEDVAVTAVFTDDSA
jgi:hypothetical protein